MKLADSGSGLVKTRNQVLVHSIQPLLPLATASKDLGKKTSKNDMKNDIFTIKLL